MGGGGGLVVARLVCMPACLFEHAEFSRFARPCANDDLQVSSDGLFFFFCGRYMPRGDTRMKRMELCPCVLLAAAAAGIGGRLMSSLPGGGMSFRAAVYCSGGGQKRWDEYGMAWHGIDVGDQCGSYRGVGVRYTRRWGTDSKLQWYDSTGRAGQSRVSMWHAV